MIKIVKV